MARFDPGQLTEQVQIQTAPGNRATDDRDSIGWVDENTQATGTATAGATVACSIRPMSAWERFTGGLDTASGQYVVTFWKNAAITESSLLLWLRKNVILQVVDAPDAGHTDLVQSVIARRTKANT